MFDAPVGTPQIRPVRPPNNRLGAVRRRPGEQHPGQSGQLSATPAATLLRPAGQAWSGGKGSPDVRQLSSHTVW